MAQEGEVGAAVHLPLDHLRFRVHAFGPAVVKRQGDGGGDGRHVEVQASGEGVDVWQVCGARGADPFLELLVVAGIWREQGGEGPDEAGEAGHLGAGGGQVAEQRLLGVAERGWPGEQEPGDAPG